MAIKREAATTGLASVLGIEISTAASIVLTKGRTALTSMDAPGSLYAGVWITR